MDRAMAFAVCDDDEIVCEAICNKIKKILAKCGISARTDKHVSPLALQKNIESGERRYDVLFLDIDMPKLSGIDLARSLKKMQDAPDIIFVSNREDLVFESFSVRPFGFVRKNNFSADLGDTLLSYINTRLVKNTYIAINTNGNSVVRKIKVSDIVYIESFRYRQYVYTADGEQLECHMSMEEFEEKLAAYDIVRIYKSYLVNLKYVQRIERSGVLLNYKGGVTLAISRDKIKELQNLYLCYLRKMGAVLFDEG
ncbi:MAG TPA: response regulator transcription factor [Candidatus Coproplasma excrementigallinarum]|uniref:Stage 0 sporulation protein A homolog n=1 Tax=Candidatus Coproplasma excrementigallinarum TaxID=2840747 RepID=A0A9D1MJ46_9FIRM|nr:response regulator transcription factor [Candidatus Coproplasma excrementigallinarum]